MTPSQGESGPAVRGEDPDTRGVGSRSKGVVALEHGGGGRQTVSFNGKTLRYSEPTFIDLSSNRSSVEYGQFPHLLFLPDA